MSVYRRRITSGRGPVPDCGGLRSRRWHTQPLHRTVRPSLSFMAENEGDAVGHREASADVERTPAVGADDGVEGFLALLGRLLQVFVFFAVARPDGHAAAPGTSRDQFDFWSRRSSLDQIRLSTGKSKRTSSMRLDNLRDLVRRQSGSGKPSRRSSQLRFLPRPDALEGRTLLSTITVKNTNDSGAGSLRQALMNAANGAVIQFSPKLDGATINLTSGALDINKNVQIVGPGANELTVGGSGVSGVFDITADGLNVTISGLTIANGSASSGAGITNGNGTLTVANDTFSDDQANGSLAGTPGLGGAIYSPGGSLTVTGSTFTFDQADGGAGAVGTSNTPFGQGGNGGDGQLGGGGAIYIGGGTGADQQQRFVDDQAASEGAGIGRSRRDGRKRR